MMELDVFHTAFEGAKPDFYSRFSRPVHNPVRALVQLGKSLWIINFDVGVGGVFNGGRHVGFCWVGVMVGCWLCRLVSCSFQVFDQTLEVTC